MYFLYLDVKCSQNYFSKYPKSHNSDVKEHGKHVNILDVLDVVELQNISEIKNSLKTASAEISVEGGSSSRFCFVYFQVAGSVKLFSLLG